MGSECTRRGCFSALPTNSDAALAVIGAKEEFPAQVLFGS
jgi:hypothetical protein